MGAIVPLETKSSKGLTKSVTVEGVQTEQLGEQGVLTLQRKELRFISETEVCFMPLSNANPGNVFHFLEDLAVWPCKEGVRRQKPLQVNCDIVHLPQPF